MERFRERINLDDRICIRTILSYGNTIKYTHSVSICIAILFFHYRFYFLRKGTTSIIIRIYCIWHSLKHTTITSLNEDYLKVFELDFFPTLKLVPWSVYPLDHRIGQECEDCWSCRKTSTTQGSVQVPRANWPTCWTILRGSQSQLFPNLYKKGILIRFKIHVTLIIPQNVTAVSAKWLQNQTGKDDVSSVTLTRFSGIVQLLGFELLAFARPAQALRSASGVATLTIHIRHGVSEPGFLVDPYVLALALVRHSADGGRVVDGQLTQFPVRNVVVKGRFQIQMNRTELAVFVTRHRFVVSNRQLADWADVHSLYGTSHLSLCGIRQLDCGQNFWWIIEGIDGDFDRTASKF